GHAVRITVCRPVLNPPHTTQQPIRSCSGKRKTGETEVRRKYLLSTSIQNQKGPSGCDFLAATCCRLGELRTLPCSPWLHPIEVTLAVKPSESQNSPGSRKS